jgi:hypothetical protein
VNEAPTERDVEGTWASLRRRKVVQWGLAYIAGAWALLQVVGFAADAFAWSPFIKQLAMLGLVLGLPVALALAWYHGDRGQQRVTELMDRADEVIRRYPRRGPEGGGVGWYMIEEVTLHALRGDKAKALARLRAMRHGGAWPRTLSYHRDLDPNLASIRNEPEFKAIFADIERDMAQQRARLAARPKDAPLDLQATGT